LAHEFAAFAQPGALIAMLLILLMMGAGSAAPQTGNFVVGS
jgi:hypothetical protein